MPHCVLPSIRLYSWLFTWTEVKWHKRHWTVSKPQHEPLSSRLGSRVLYRPYTVTWRWRYGNDAGTNFNFILGSENHRSSSTNPLPRCLAAAAKADIGRRAGNLGRGELPERWIEGEVSWGRGELWESWGRGELWESWGRGELREIWAGWEVSWVRGELGERWVGGEVSCGRAEGEVSWGTYELVERWAGWEVSWVRGELGERWAREDVSWGRSQLGGRWSN